MRRIWIGMWTAVLFAVVILLVTWPVVDIFLVREQTVQRIAQLQERIAQMDEESLRHQKNLAKWYNLHLDSEVISGTYESILNLDSGMMGCLEIPAIGVAVPIYHGAEETALGVTHAPTSAFPIGGRGNLTVLSGLGDISDLASGDLVYIHILGETRVYTVGEQGADQCTLQGRNRTGQDMQISCVRLDPELEQNVSVLSIDAGKIIKAVQMAVAAALGAGMIPVLISLIRRRIQQGKAA